MTTGDYLRSINIASDLKFPSRLAHYQPTQKSLDVIRAVAGGKPSPATLVIAAYGSGKSLAAAIGGLIVDNSPATWPALETIAPRLRAVDPRYAKALKQRTEGAGRGLVLVLHGHIADLSAALSAAAGCKLGADLAATLDHIPAQAVRKGADRIAVIWDEFGRHLDGLVEQGRSGELLAVQELAEWAVRQMDPTASFTALLHQSLLAYGGRLSQAARASWRKVEGRFGVLRFVEDSVELYELIARLIAEARPIRRPVDDAKSLAAPAHEHGFFTGFDDQERLASALAEAGAITPAALALLPQLSSRVAQNERSVFTFLAELEQSRADPSLGQIGIEELYRYFGEAMRSDTGGGGTHRRWIETESARSRADDALEREVLAAACLLQLGAAGERRRLPVARLRFAVEAGSSHPEGMVEQAIADLLERKLLLHRHRNDDVSVWHGADLDVRGLIEAQKASASAEFALLATLAAECPAPVMQPLRYNSERAITRYFTGTYLRAADFLAAALDDLTLAPADDADGRILYLIPDSQEQLEAAAAHAAHLPNERSDLVVVIPNRPLEIGEVALELFVLRRLLRDHALLDQDPLIERELEELAAVARDNLVRLTDELTRPERQSAMWCTAGRDLGVDRVIPAAEALSRLTEERFGRTPRIQNEQIVRRKLSRPMVNARKKCVGAIIEQSGQPELGMAGWTTPDASIARTVLIRTGLYREAGDRTWRWASPDEVTDPDLAAVWRHIECFFAEPRATTKTFDELTGALSAPPYGLRTGLLPVLLAAGLKAFARCVAIRELTDASPVYLPDIKPSIIERIATVPGRFEIEVLALDDGIELYLRAIRDEFALAADAHEADLVRACFDAIDAWRRQLPEAALTTKRLGDEVAPFQLALRVTSDPIDLLFRAFPVIASGAGDWDDVLCYVSRMRKRVEDLKEGYALEAIAIASRLFGVARNGDSNLLERVQSWVDCFPMDVLPLDQLDGQTKSILNRGRSLANGHDTESSFARALSGILLGKDFERWNDGTGRLFERELHGRLQAVERAALATDEPTAAMAPLLQNRIAELLVRLRNSVGPDATAAFVKDIIDRNSLK